MHAVSVIRLMYRQPHKYHEFIGSNVTAVTVKKHLRRGGVSSADLADFFFQFFFCHESKADGCPKRL